MIFVHRMLKNGVPQRSDYALLTQPALRRMELDPAALGMQPHVENYEHFGAVECFENV